MAPAFAVLLTLGPGFLAPLQRGAVERPALSGPEKTLDRGRFRLHYTLEGADAPPADDADADGVPDLVTTVGTALLQAEATYARAGWRPLVDDASGDIDVYVHDIDVFGYATPVPAGDADGASCFLEIDRGASVLGSVAASVATHELHHCVQFRYSVATAPWLYEATSTYEQYAHVLDPVLDFASAALWVERLSAPERRLDDVDGRFEYAAFLWAKYWTERGGADPDRSPAMWRRWSGRQRLGHCARRRSGRQFGDDLGDAFLEFTWNAFACGNDDGEHYLGDPIPCTATLGAPIADWDGRDLVLQHPRRPVHHRLPGAAHLAAWTAVQCDGDGVRLGGVALDRDGHTLAKGHTAGLLFHRARGLLRLVVAGLAPRSTPSVPRSRRRWAVATRAAAAAGAAARRWPCGAATRRRCSRCGRGPGASVDVEALRRPRRAQRGRRPRRSRRARRRRGCARRVSARRAAPSACSATRPCSTRRAPARARRPGRGFHHLGGHRAGIIDTACSSRVRRPRARGLRRRRRRAAGSRHRRRADPRAAARGVRRGQRAQRLGAVGIGAGACQAEDATSVHDAAVTRAATAPAVRDRSRTR
ncbi:MAG: hypothetical protein R3F59_17605 [Myxococcota bacterium]